MMLSVGTGLGDGFTKISLFIHFEQSHLSIGTQDKFKVLLQGFGYLLESKGHLILCVFALTMLFRS